MKGYNFTVNVTKQRTIIVEAEDDVHAIEKVANRLDKIMVEEENVTGADIDDFKFIIFIIAKALFFYRDNLYIMLLNYLRDYYLHLVVL